MSEPARRKRSKKQKGSEIGRPTNRSYYGEAAQMPSGVMYANTVSRRAATTAARVMEHKTFDYNPTGADVLMTSDNDVAPAATPFAPVAGATGGCINQVPLGNSSITRTGRKLSITAVAIRGTIKLQAATISQKVALLLIWDRNVNQAASLPAWTAVLNSQSPNALTNKDNAPRFKILRRWDFTLSGNGGGGGYLDSSITSIDEFVKMKNKVTYFTTADTTGLYPNMQEGALLLYLVGDSATGANCTLGTFNTRVYFQDA